MMPGNGDGDAFSKKARPQIKTTSTDGVSGNEAAAVKAPVLRLPGMHRRHVRRCGECAAPLGQAQSDLCPECEAGVSLVKRIEARRVMMALLAGV